MKYILLLLLLAPLVAAADCSTNWIQWDDEAMRITVANARALAASLTSAAATAQAAGATDFDLLDTLGAVDDAARTQLQAAIAAADNQSDR